MPANFFHKLSFENIFLKISPLVPRSFPTYSQYSDFFPFVYNTNLTTIIYALNYSFFLQPQFKQSESIIVSIFDRQGVLIRDFSHDLNSDTFFTPINLAAFLPIDSYGSFTIYHRFDPSILNLSSVFADRSYISFANIDSKFQHFFHGNQDSIVYSSDPKILRPLRPSFIPRVYRPQFTFESDTLYTLIFSNPTKKRLFYIIKCTNIFFQTFYRYFLIPPMGTNFLELPLHHNPFHITIISNHPFPRPVIMTGSQTQLSDIFHS